MARRDPGEAIDALLGNLGRLSGPAPVPLTESVKEEAPKAPEGRMFGGRGSKPGPGDVCPHCHYGVLREDVSFAGVPCEFFAYCPACNAHICTYDPMPHQAAFHMDGHMQKMYAGGFGSAKTYTCGMEFLAHVLQIPGAVALMGASTWGQVSSTCLKFVTENLPRALVARANQDKVNWYLQLINGARIEAKALDDEGKIRSANLTMIWVEEASEVEWSVVAFILARLRNKAAFFKGKSRLKMLLSTNPDVGWPKEEWLETSSLIAKHGDVRGDYRVDPRKADPSRSTHISATSANVYLPPDYEENLSRNRPDWWVKRYLKGSFEYSEGLVYPDFASWFEDPFPIPSWWPRVTGTDFGRNDPTAHVAAAVDPIKGVIHVYGEVEETLGDRDVSWVLGLIKACDGTLGNRMFPNQADPRGRNRDQVSGRSWFDAYAAAGYPVMAAEGCGRDSLAPTIAKVQQYASAGRLKFFSTLRKVRDSLSRYKYRPKSLGDEDNRGESPIDRNNHLPDAIRYMMAPFPPFPPDPASFDDVWRAAMVQARESSRRPYDPLSSDPDDGGVTDMLDNFG